jgi:hypothetical protein
MMRRREFITLLGGAAAWPLAARAQQPSPVIGFLSNLSPDPILRPLAAFRRALQEAGYIEGQNIAIEFRWAEGRNHRLPELVSDLVRRQVAAIVATGGGASALAAVGLVGTLPDGPLRLTDDQLAAVIRAAEPLAVGDRDAFLHDIAAALQGREVGDGEVYRTIARVQQRYYDPPILGPEPRWRR